MIQQIFATQSALSRSEVFWFSFRYPKEKNSPDLSCTVCAPMIRGILSYLSSDPIFFSAYLFQMGSEGIFLFPSDLSVFRSAQPRSDGFLPPPIRRIFSPADPTVFCHLRSDGFWSPQIRRIFHHPIPDGFLIIKIKQVVEPGRSEQNSSRMQCQTMI